VPFLIPGTGASVSASPFVIAFVWKQLLHYPNWAGGRREFQTGLQIIIQKGEHAGRDVGCATHPSPPSIGTGSGPAGIYKRELMPRRRIKLI
jgi:hypothetical protein